MTPPLGRIQNSEKVLTAHPSASPNGNILLNKISPRTSTTNADLLRAKQLKHSMEHNTFSNKKPFQEAYNSKASNSHPSNTGTTGSTINERKNRSKLMKQTPPSTYISLHKSPSKITPIISNTSTHNPNSTLQSSSAHSHTNSNKYHNLPSSSNKHNQNQNHNHTFTPLPNPKKASSALNHQHQQQQQHQQHHTQGQTQTQTQPQTHTQVSGSGGLSSGSAQVLKDMEMERSLVKLKEKFVSRAGGACALKRAPGSKEGSLGRKSYYQNVPSNPNLFSNVNLPSRTREGAKEDANRSSSAARRGGVSTKYEKYESTLSKPDNKPHVASGYKASNYDNIYKRYLERPGTKDYAKYYPH
jgi:hypothetical protein